MTKTILTIIITLLTLSGIHATGRKGVGCWRGVPLSQMKPSKARAQVSGKENTANHFFGHKKGLVILAQFQDVKFKEGNNLEKYKLILNKPGYTSDEGFRGSVRDYFIDQSDSLFQPTFDVVGPYTAEFNEEHYGTNDEEGYDLRPDQLIREMCLAADDDVDFSEYDWNGDGAVDEVFVLYAGKGEADNTSNTSLIWPHMWGLSETDKGILTLDGMTIDIYACCNEIKSFGTINGIGTLCHEFSHCLGLPDFYNIMGTYGNEMGAFDLMISGNYNDGTFCPAGYTAYEKMLCGWITPIELSQTDVSVVNLKAMSEHGDAYIIYNDAFHDEFYMIENRQKTGWDTAYPTTGLLITHVDYDEEVWENNLPNTIITEEKALEYGFTCGNDHQRMTFFNASNKSYLPRLYPYQSLDSLTATSTPAATLFHRNSINNELMQGAILQITQNDDGTMNFYYRAGKKPETDAISVLTTLPSATTVYSIDGRPIKKKDARKLRPGIYIVSGKKVVF